MDKNRIPHIMYKYRATGYSNIGRPCILYAKLKEMMMMMMMIMIMMVVTRVDFKICRP